MKSPSPPLLPLLRSRAQGDIIAWIFLHPERDYSLVEIARSVGVSPATVMREVDRLSDAGLVVETRRGNTRLVRVATDNAVFRPLADLMTVTFGAVPVLSELLGEVSGIDEAFIYGSFADRYGGAAGQVPNDIDVLAIGDPDPDALDAVADRAGRRLGREVNIRRVRDATWRDDSRTDSFRQTVMSRPRVMLVKRGTESG